MLALFLCSSPLRMTWTSHRRTSPPLQTSSANCLSVSDTRIFVGCAAGVVRLFDASSLNYITTLPRPHALGVDVAASPDIPHSCGGYESEFADVNALTFDSVRHGFLPCH